MTRRCNVCGVLYRARVPLTWARREARKRLDYPALPCVPCVQAEARGAALGIDPAALRNPERRPQ